MAGAGATQAEVAEAADAQQLLGRRENEVAGADRLLDAVLKPGVVGAQRLLCARGDGARQLFGRHLLR